MLVDRLDFMRSFQPSMSSILLLSFCRLSKVEEKTVSMMYQWRMMSMRIMGHLDIRRVLAVGGGKEGRGVIETGGWLARIGRGYNDAIER